MKLDDIEDNKSTCMDTKISTKEPSVFEVSEGRKFKPIEIEKDSILSKDNFYGNNKPKRIGNLYVFCFNKENEPIFAIGPHWPFFLCLSTTLFMMTYFFFTYLWKDINIFMRYVGILIYLSQNISYTYTFLINPGLPNKNTKLSNSSQKICDICSIIINTEEKTNHCDDCNVCIVGYDHHCPWTSKCIGKGNLVGFYFFITTTMLLFGYFIFTISMIK